MPAGASLLLFVHDPLDSEVPSCGSRSPTEHQRPSRAEPSVFVCASIMSTACLQTPLLSLLSGLRLLIWTKLIKISINYQWSNTRASRGCIVRHSVTKPGVGAVCVSCSRIYGWCRSLCLSLNLYDSSAQGKHGDYV